jgi:hypothetical protein
MLVGQSREDIRRRQFTGANNRRFQRRCSRCRIAREFYAEKRGIADDHLVELDCPTEEESRTNKLGGAYTKRDDIIRCVLEECDTFIKFGKPSCALDLTRRVLRIVPESPAFTAPPQKGERSHS